MNEPAQDLNREILQKNPHVYELLSELGKNLYYPKGILTQSAEAKQKAYRFNATIGIATELDQPMFLPLIQETLANCDPNDLYPYAPPAGKPELRQLWREKLIIDNPSLKGKSFSNPIVTNALTHGLSIVADLFIDEHDPLVLPDKLWGILNALEKKTLGIIRGTISSASHPSQTFVLNALQSPDFQTQKQEKFEILRKRACKVKQILEQGKYRAAWDYYPFNSGYFMCLKLKGVQAEVLRNHLLYQYGVGIISLGESDVRVAFSCVEEQELEQLFNLIYQGCQDLSV